MMDEAKQSTQRRLIHRLPAPVAIVVFALSVLATWLIPGVLVWHNSIAASIAAIVLLGVYGTFVSPRSGFGPLWLELLEMALVAQTILITVYAIVFFIKSSVAPSA